MDENTSKGYENIISRKDAVRLACFYLQERVRNGSRPDVIFKHAVHIFNVAKIAEYIAKQTAASPDSLDPDTAYILGLIHDIGRIKDETKTKVPHGLEGFNFLVRKGLKKLAPISLTHNFVSKQINPDDFPVYSKQQIRLAKSYLSDIEYNDYDRLIQLADTFSRGNEILSIQERIDKNKQFYHTSLSFAPKIFDLRNYFNNKYNINVEALVDVLFNRKPDKKKTSVTRAPAFSLSPAKTYSFLPKKDSFSII